MHQLSQIHLADLRGGDNAREYILDAIVLDVSLQAYLQICDSFLLCFSLTQCRDIGDECGETAFYRIGNKLNGDIRQWRHNAPIVPCHAQFGNAMYHERISELFNDHGWRIILESATLPDGRKKNVARVERADSVHLLAFLHDDDRVLILREYRPYYGTYIWMLPSGRADKEKDMESAAQRELQEETGYRANDLKFYCATHHSESMVFANHIFIARDLVQDLLPQDADEMIEVHELSLEEALQNVLGSVYVHTASAYALLRYMKERG